jgi:hypothetical protein
MRVVWIAGCVAAFALTVGVQSAMAEAQAAQRTDPKAESPAGVIYQIPLDSARRDAAPVLHTGRRDGGGSASGLAGPGGGSGGANGGQSPSSTGSATASSADASGHAGGALSASASEGGGTPQNPSSIHSENGFGSASQVPGLSQAAARTGAGVAATSAAGSTTPTYLLIALIAAAAIGMGLIATRHSRHRGAGRPPAAGG